MYSRPQKPISPLAEEFPVGITVENIGYRAKVVGYNIGAGMLILQNDVIGKWLADPYKCVVPIQKPVPEGQIPVIM